MPYASVLPQEPGLLCLVLRSSDRSMYVADSEAGFELLRGRRWTLLMRYAQGAGEALHSLGATRRGLSERIRQLGARRMLRWICN
jgi:hypothetical protein